MLTPTDRIDPELGVVRRCRICGEEWPLDGEFFGSIGPGRNRRSTCRACRMDSVRLAQARRRERHRDAIRARDRERYWAKKTAVAVTA